LAPFQEQSFHYKPDSSGSPEFKHDLFVFMVCLLVSQVSSGYSEWQGFTRQELQSFRFQIKRIPSLHVLEMNSLVLLAGFSPALRSGEEPEPL
jgi:hypothetical protein